MKHLIIVLVLILLTTCSTQSDRKSTDDEVTFTEEELAAFFPQPGNLPITRFPEIWGYVEVGAESALRRGLPITDIAYFSAQVNYYGELANIPDRKNLPAFPARVHLVVTCFSYSITYFSIMPGTPQRAKLIRDLIVATRDYDGLNIDFENIPQRSGDAFLSFLQELKEGMPNKILSVCLYAKTRTRANDVYDYMKIKPLVDRIFVMAYDQHWSGGPAGPVSSISWCKSVADYCMRVIGKEKLIMGIPFYGRGWASQNHHRSLIYSTTQRMITTHNATVTRENGTPTFSYSPNITVKVYYEDEYTISARFQIYKSLGVNAVGFWRIGYETPNVWGTLRIGE